MGNQCNSIFAEINKNDVPVVELKSKEIEIRNCLGFLIGKSFSNKSDNQKIIINTQKDQLIFNIEYVKEEDVKELKEHHKMFQDILSKSNDKFNMLKLETYGIFDENKNLIELTKTLISNYYCHKITFEEKYRTRYKLLD